MNYAFCCLQWLDGKEISRAERIQALQELDAVRTRVLQQETEYLEKRQKQKSNANEHPEINQ